MSKIELTIAVDDDAAARAREQGVDLAHIAQEAVDLAVRDLRDKQEADRLAAQNAAAIQAHQERIDKFGVFGDDLRTW